MADIEGGVSPLQAQAVGLGRYAWIVVATETGDVINGMRPSVMQIHFEATTQPAAERRLQTVVMGMAARTSKLYRTESRVWPCAAERRIGEVVIGLAHDTPGTATHL